MARVFISHSSRDAEAAAWIADWLRQSGFEAPFLDFDKHSGIPPGADWERTLYREIASAQALLILQSAHWDASKWCFAEFAQARALGKPIFQVVGAPGTAGREDHTTPAPICGDLQQLDLRPDQPAALTALARELSALALNDRGGFPWDSSRSPYPGLLCFDQEDAAIYFGRDPEIRALIEQLEVLRIHGEGRLLVLLGASGSGKSSLLRAGVLPRLARLRDGDLLSGGDDGYLRRWRNGKLVGSPIKTPHTTVVSLVIRRNRDWVSGGSGGDIQLWHQGRPLGDYFQVASGSVWSLLERRNGELVSANGDGTLSIFPTPARAIQRACQHLIAAGALGDPKEPAEKEAARLC
jgi:hypothetical protein